MLVQRATVLDWVRAARVMTSQFECDAGTLERKLSNIKSEKNPVGAPPVVRERIKRQMLHDLRSAKFSTAELKKIKQDALHAEYGASRKVCAEARIEALAEAERQGLL
jgi:hypothetical protein